jgi:hypothetical protein
MTNYLFRNKQTGEIRRGVSFSLNSAARLAGLDVPYHSTLPEPWMPWEHWESPTKCVWHYTEQGECIAGPRQ